MQNNERFIKLSFKKEVFQEIYNIISTSKISQSPETFLNKENSLYYLKHNDDEYFQEILKTSINEFLINMANNDLTEIEMYDESIFDKKFMYIKKIGCS